MLQRWGWGPLCCWSPSEAGDAHPPCCGEERVRLCHHALLASSRQAVPPAAGHVLHQWQRDKEIRVRAAGGVGEPPPTVATAGSCGEGAELGREVRRDGCRAEAGPSAAVGFQRCKVRTSSAAPAAASWYWCTVGCCGLEMLAVHKVAWAAGGVVGHSSPCHDRDVRAPHFPFGLAQHFPIVSCQHLKIVPTVLKNQKTPNLPSPSPLPSPQTLSP